MAYRYRRPRPAPVPKPEPIEVDIETLIGAMHAAPSFRAHVLNEIHAVTRPRWMARYGKSRNAVTMYNGRKKVDSIQAGNVVMIQPQKWGWRITVSMTGEPTPYIIDEGPAPVGCDKISESAGLVIYQTTASLTKAAMWQLGQVKPRREIGLSMLDEAIALKFKHVDDSVIARAKGNYKVFTNCTALALGPGTDGEGQAAMSAALRMARKILTTNYQGA